MRKKKKRLDPAVVRARVQRKIKKFEKEIRRLDRKGRVLKPIDEIEGDRQLYKTLGSVAIEVISALIIFWFLFFFI